MGCAAIASVQVFHNNTELDQLSLRLRPVQPLRPRTIKNEDIEKL